MKHEHKLLKLCAAKHLVLKTIIHKASLWLKQYRLRVLESRGAMKRVKKNSSLPFTFLFKTNR